MKLSKILSAIVLISLFILPFVSFGIATNTSEYVGISENDEIIWDVEIDKDPYKDYMQDFNPTLEEDVIDTIVNGRFKGKIDEDVVAWKYVILDIKDEKEHSYYENGTDYKAVPYYFSSYYIKEEAKDWKTILKYHKSYLYKYDREFYRGITPYPDNEFFMEFIVPKDMNWKYLVNEADENLEDKLDGEGGARRPVEIYVYTFKQELDGISCFYDEGEHLDNDDVGEWESTSIYNDDGILKYYEWLYGGDPIVIFELQENFFIANWWIIAMIAAAAVVVIVVVVILRRPRNQ